MAPFFKNHNNNNNGSDERAAHNWEVEHNRFCNTNFLRKWRKIIVRMGRNLLYDEIGEYRIKLMNRSSPLPKHIVDNELHPISRKRYLELQTIMRKNKESYKNNTVSSLSVSRLLNKRIQSDCSRQKYCSSKDLKRKHQTLSTIEEDTE